MSAIIFPRMLSKDTIGQTIFDLAKDRTKRTEEAFHELCEKLKIQADTESESIFRKYKATHSNLEKTIDHFYKKLWTANTPAYPRREINFDEDDWDDTI